MTAWCWCQLSNFTVTSTFSFFVLLISRIMTLCPALTALCVHAAISRIMTLYPVLTVRCVCTRLSLGS